MYSNKQVSSTCTCSLINTEKQYRSDISTLLSEVVHPSYKRTHTRTLVTNVLTHFTNSLTHAHFGGLDTSAH